MPYSTVQYTGTGAQTQFAVPFPFISRDHVLVTVDGINKTFSWISDGLISITPAPASGKLVTVQRNSSRTQRLVDFQDATTLTEADLDLANTQAIYISQEAFDASDLDSVTSTVTALRDAAGVHAANAAASAVAADLSADASAVSADESAASAALAAVNAAGAEALNRVLKVGDTMTGELKMVLAGGTTYGGTRTFTWRDTSGTPDYRSWAWFCWSPYSTTFPGYESGLSLGPCLDSYQPTTAMLHLLTSSTPGTHPNKIVLGSTVQLRTNSFTPDDDGVEAAFEDIEAKRLTLKEGLSLTSNGGYPAYCFFAGSGARIAGDFSNATIADRLMFQNALEAASNVGILPGDLATGSTLTVHLDPIPTNTSTGALSINTGDVRVVSGRTGSGGFLPLTFYTSATERMKIEAAGNVLINANLKFPNASSRILTKGTASPVGERTMFQCHETNQNTVLGAIPNGTATLAAIQVYNNSDLTAACSYVDIRSGASIHSIYSGGANGGATLPLQVSVGGHLHRFETSGCLNFADATDPGFGGAWRGLSMKGGSASEGSYIRLANSDDTAILDFIVSSTYAATMSMVSALPIIFKTTNVERLRLSATGVLTLTTPDSSTGFLLSGTSKGLRMYTSAAGAAVEGVDNTGGASYQPLFVGGSVVDLTTSGNTRLGLESDGRIYTKAIHNNGTVTGTTKQYLASGTYTPSYANVANTTAATPGLCQWTRVGNIVTVSGRASITTTTGATNTSVRLTLPIASAFTSANQCNGVCQPDNTGVVNYGGTIVADATNDQATLTWRSSATTGALNHSFTFQYEVL